MSARQPAPELPADLEWVNARDVPRLGRMRRRVVLLNFFTYSNANSLGALADIRYLENKYHDGLSVLSLHCPKFAQERVSANVLKAVNRNYIRHPVANDLDFRAWQLFDVRGWPTTILLDTEGNIAASLPGEGRRAELDAMIGQILEDAAQRDLREYEASVPVTRAEPKLPLRFPGRVLATENMLYVADAGHNRILECTHEGRILRQFGSGNPGFWDGRGQDAGFSSPAGMTIIKDALYVADTGNHAIRRIRLLSAEVETVAGTGQPGAVIARDHADPRTVPLNSPVDVSGSAERLFIANAANNQVWVLDLGRNRIGVFVGSGQHGFADGTGEGAQLAKPMGLATQAQMLYIADADSSSIRAVRFIDNNVKTLIGAGLYEFGDADGLPDKARLQHPTGVALDPGGSILWVADTYNNKIKALSLRGGGARTLALPYRFHEPMGISVAAKSLWIANTNAHEIVRIDTGSGQIKRLPVGE